MSKIYPNNKPWVTKSVKSSIQAKKLAFKHGAAPELHTATKELKIEILRAKQNYKLKLENKMATNNLGSAWSSMKAIAGLSYSKNSSTVTLDGFNSDSDFANALNCFYSRFDTFDFYIKIQEMSHKLEDNQHFNIEQKDIEKALFSIRPKKSHGPDNICGRLLKLCATELCPILHHIFNKSLQTQHVPKCWKDAVVVPVSYCEDKLCQNS